MKGVSQVITTIILVSLVLASVGIVWSVINNIIQLSPDVECTNFEITQPIAIQNSYYQQNEVNLTLKRSEDNFNITGFKFSFSNGEVFLVEGNKCLDVRTKDEYGKTCELLSVSQEKTYFFKASNAESVFIEAQIIGKDNKKQFCTIGNKEIKTI